MINYQRKYERLHDIFTTVAAVHPNMEMADALKLVLAVEAKPDVANHAEIDSIDALADFAYSQPSVMAFIPDKKINAIKELRSLVHALPPERFGSRDPMTMGSLRSCKDAIEKIWR